MDSHDTWTSQQPRRQTARWTEASNAARITADRFTHHRPNKLNNYWTNWHSWIFDDRRAITSSVNVFMESRNQKIKLVDPIFLSSGVQHPPPKLLLNQLCLKYQSQTQNTYQNFGQPIHLFLIRNLRSGVRTWGVFDSESKSWNIECQFVQ